MRFGIVTIFPGMFRAVSDYGVTSRAISLDKLTIAYSNPRDFTKDAYQTVDDRPFGGGPGMVMKAEPLSAAVADLKHQLGADTLVIAMSPQGKKMQQQDLQELSARGKAILIAGRYAGIDERFIATDVDEQWSIGDYVLSGGEIAAMAIVDGVARLDEGVLNNQQSVEDSFSCGLLDYPQYTRPSEYQGLKVPEVLLSGDHKEIAKWRRQMQLGRTQQLRPKLLEDLNLSLDDQRLLSDYLSEHG